MVENEEVKKYMDEFCIEERPGPCSVVIFGASGDLANRKLIPSLFNLFQKKLLPRNFYLMGFARTGIDTETFRLRIKKAIPETLQEVSKGALNAFLEVCFYQAGDYNDFHDYSELKNNLERLDERFGAEGSHIFYLATPPNLALSIVGMLDSSGQVKKGSEGEAWTHVVIEKPFGHDLESARLLDARLHEVLAEDQIYRIDHYLGKETVQNILMFRFANMVFEPVWNNKYVDHVQITVAEDIGVGSRAGYYEQAGLLRDMFQNHMLQMLALVAMEEPASFGADSVRDRKVELLKSINPFSLDELGRWMVRAQYTSGKVGNRRVGGYRDERGVARDSMVETYVAAKVMLDTPRWQGVPFYLRSGKRMPRKVSEIAVTFKPVVCKLFSDMPGLNLSPNILVLNVQPEEGISLVIQAKHPGPKLCMSSLTMDFCYQEVFGAAPPDAYQRLLLDCMLGDQTLFIRSDSMEVAWSLITPVLQKWEAEPHAMPLYHYEAGTPGPREANELLMKDGRRWYLSRRGCK